METVLFFDRQFCIACTAPYIFLQGEHGSGPRTHVLPSTCDTASGQSRSHLLPVQASTLHPSTSEVPGRLPGRPGAFPSVVSVLCSSMAHGGNEGTAESCVEGVETTAKHNRGT